MWLYGSQICFMSSSPNMEICLNPSCMQSVVSMAKMTALDICFIASMLTQSKLRNSALCQLSEVMRHVDGSHLDCMRQSKDMVTARVEVSGLVKPRRWG